MGLTSGGLIGLVIVIAVGLIVVTIWCWPRFAGAGVRPMLARLGLFTGAQVSLLLVTLLAVNNYYIFYVSWTDLLGGGSTRSAKIENIATAGQAPGNRPGRPLARVAMKLGKHGKKPNEARDGRLDKVNVVGERTGLRTQAYVWLPPQYFQPQYVKRRFPVMYDFTGYPGNPLQLVKRMKVPAVAGRLMYERRAEPMIIVMMKPTPDSLGQRDTECTDVPAGPQVLSFYTQDLPDALANTYNVATNRRGWGALGDSTGGYCAVKLAMMRSDRFSAAVSMAGYFYPREDPTTGDLYGGSKKVKADNNLIGRLTSLPAPPISVLVTTSREGERDFGQARKFIQSVKPPMFSQTIIVDKGGHNPHTWKRVLPGALTWMGQRLQHEGP